jgi:hypothetical protein
MTMLGSKRVKISTIRDDIDHGECSNRGHCVLANALVRTFRLDKHCYVRVDARTAGVTVDGKRYRHKTPAAAMRYLRRFDDIGKKKGIEAARAATKPASFVFELEEVIPVNASASAERKAQINAARNKKAAAERKAGTYERKNYARYAGL